MTERRAACSPIYQQTKTRRRLRDKCATAVSLNILIMSDLEAEMNRVIDAVFNACTTSVNQTGTPSITRNEVFGKSRKENAVMVRTILATALSRDGYSVTTIGELLGRTEHQTRLIIAAHDAYKSTSNAYRIAIQEIKRTLNGCNSDVKRT